MLKRFIDNFYNLTTIILRKTNLKTQMRNNKSPSATKIFFSKRCLMSSLKKFRKVLQKLLE
jgi:hypothetical protein